MKKFLSILVSLLMLVSVMSALFSTSYAATNISTVAVTGIDTPLPGRALDLNGVIASEGYTFYSENPITWFDLNSGNSNKSIPNDSKFIEGHSYRVMVKLRTNSGYEFATNNNQPTVTAAINSGFADVSGYGNESPKNYIVISYTFPACSKKHISSVKVEAKTTIQKGTELTADLLKVSGEGVLGMVPVWNHDGVGVEYGTIVNHGNYGVALTITADTGYYFDQNTVINFSAQSFNPTFVPSSWIIVAKTSDNFFSIPCTHDNISGNWTYDNAEHWHECTECNEKFNVAAHTFDGGVENGNKTTYTCGGCGYQKIVNGNTQGFTYAACGTGAEIVRYLGNDASVTVPNEIGGLRVVRIGRECFTNNATLTSVTIPSTVTSIGKYAFSGCSNLVSITIPEGVTKIEASTFANCSNLVSANIPRKVEIIEESAFSGCSKLGNVIIPCGVTKIGNNAFMQCDEITKVVIPDTVTSLGTGVFSNCEKLQTAVIGNGISSIPSTTFDTCTALTTVTLPKVTSIGTYAFADDNALTKVNFRGTVAEWNSITISHNTTHNKPVVDAEKVYSYEGKEDIGQHNFQTTATVEPTCVEEGFTLHVCTGCGDSFKDNIVPATGVHTYNSGIVTKDATCTEKGEKTYTCNACGHSHTEDVQATGIHTWDNGKITKSATYDAEGIKTYTCSNCGATKTEKIAKLTRTNIEKIAVTGIKNKTYNGKKQTQKITVKLGNVTLKEGTDYTLTYKNNKKIGTATVVITGKGAYTGTVNKSFKINPKGTSLKKLSAGKKQFKATWNKQTTETTGYQIEYSTNKNFKSSKTSKIKKNKTTSSTVKSLKAKKKYYVRIRTYKTVSGKTYYSNWSSAKNVTTKK